MRKSIPTLGVVSAGLLLVGSPAQAVDTNMSSNLNVGIANGIQAHLPIQAPINLCGNAIGLLGTASAYCDGGANANYASGQQNLNLQYIQTARHLARGQQWPGQQWPGQQGGVFGGSGDSDLSSNLNVGVANGIQVDAQVQAPVNVCGNAIGILGDAIATCVTSGANANAFSPTVQSTLILDNALNNGSGGDWDGDGDWDDDGGNSYVLPYGNTQPRPIAPAAKPNAAKPTAAKPTAAKATTVKPAAGKPAAGKPTAVKPTGAKTTAAKTTPNKKAEQGLLANLLSPVTSLLSGGGGGAGWAGERCGDTDMSTFGNVGIANGIQAHAPIQVPVNLAGNALGLGGSASAYTVGGANANYCS